MFFYVFFIVWNYARLRVRLALANAMAQSNKSEGRKECTHMDNGTTVMSDEYRVNKTIDRLRERTGKYRHEIQGWLVNPYKAVRLHLRWPVHQMASFLGLTTDALKYRERTKQSFYLLEIVMLFEVSGMTPEEFVEMLRDIA